MCPLILYLRHSDTVIVTPHIAGASEEAIELTDSFVLDRFEDEPVDPQPC